MLTHVARAFNSGMSDVLGRIYMESGFSNMKGGQVFTPWPICQAMATTTIDNVEVKPVYLLMEPACGSGALVLAAAEIFEKSGRPVGKHLWADMTDADVVCQRMAYIQMSLVGVPGVVRHGNSLSNEYHENAVTPAGVALYHDSMYLRLRLSGKRGRRRRRKTRTRNPNRRRQ